MEELIKKVLAALKVFPRYAQYQQIAIVVWILLSLYIGYLLTKGRPPSIIYRLQMYEGLADEISEGDLKFPVSVYNASDPATEVHNVRVQITVPIAALVSIGKPPETRSSTHATYRFDYPVLQRDTSEYLMDISLHLPTGTSEQIIYWVVASEVDNTVGGWTLINEGGKLKTKSFSGVNKPASQQ